jgi:hypothetical protein
MRYLNFIGRLRCDGMREVTYKIFFTLWMVFVLWMIVTSCYGVSSIIRYDVEKFNCVDFTSETLAILRACWIPCYQVVGICNDNESRGHSWVGIDFFGTIIHIEPQIMLPFIPETDYHDIYINREATTRYHPHK